MSVGRWRVSFSPSFWPVFSSPLFFACWRRRFIRPLLQPFIRPSRPAPRVLTRALVPRLCLSDPSAPVSLLWGASFYFYSPKASSTYPRPASAAVALLPRVRSHANSPASPPVGKQTPLSPLSSWFWALPAPWLEVFASCVCVFRFLPSTNITPAAFSPPRAGAPTLFLWSSSLTFPIEEERYSTIRLPLAFASGLTALSPTKGTSPSRPRLPADVDRV